LAAAIPSREAKPATAAWNVSKTLGQTAIFWSTLLFLVPALIYRVEEAMGLGAFRFAAPIWRAAGVLLFGLGGSLGLTSGLIMAIQGRGTPLPLDCPRELVLAGPYRYVRNPMAIAGLGQGAAVGLYLGSPSILAYVLTGLLIWNFGVRPGEEADLEARFGEPYRAYRSGVLCWRPRLRGYDPAGRSHT
jgi:protein-S-isoprenylcysteine O-methyltransferase Ste14